jgi:hypothetical protein
MSSWRRFFATLSALSLLHLILLSGGGGCLMPSAVASEAHAAAHGEDHRTAASDAGAAEAPGRGYHAHVAGSRLADEQPVDADSAGDERGGARLCTSLAPCSIAVAPAASVAATPAPPATEKLDWSPHVLSSIALAPELPPPRA